MTVHTYVAEITPSSGDEEETDFLGFDMAKGQGREFGTDSNDRIFTGTGRAGTRTDPDAAVVGNEEGTAFERGEIWEMNETRDELMEWLGPREEDDFTTRTTETTTTTPGTTTSAPPDDAFEFEFPNIRDEQVSVEVTEAGDEETSAAWEAVWNDDTYQTVRNQARDLGFEREGFGLHATRWDPNGDIVEFNWVTTTVETEEGDYGYFMTPVERNDDGSYRVTDQPASILTRQSGDQVNVQSIVLGPRERPIVLGLVTALAHFEDMFGCGFDEWGLICSLKYFGLGRLSPRLTPRTVVDEDGFVTRAVERVGQQVSEENNDTWWEWWVDCMVAGHEEGESIRSCLEDCHDECTPIPGPACIECLMNCEVGWWLLLSCAWDCGVDLRENRTTEGGRLR